MNKKYIYILTLILTILISSCSDKSLQNDIEGQWAMEILTFDGKNYISQIYTNVIVFKEHNEIFIPESFHFKRDNNATWKVLKDKKTIEISTSNTVFNGIFEVEFINRTESNPIGIRLKSKNAYIKAYKLLDFL